MGARRAKRTPRRSRRPTARSTGHLSELVRAVSKYLASTNPKLSERGRATFAREFLAAGNAAVQAVHGSLEESVAAMGFQRRMLTASRLRVAQHSQPGQDALQSDEFRRIHDTLVYHWRRLKEYPNVVGFGAGFRFSDGLRTDERCASILVSRKVSKQQLSRGKSDCLPKTLRRGGYSVSVDVFEVGDFELYAGPSSCIAPQADPGRSSTLGVFATDNDGSGSLALTALHAAGEDLQVYPPDGGGGQPIAFVTEDGDAQTLLGELLRGTRRNGIDAAAIKLADGQQPSRFLPGVGEVKNWRVLSKDVDAGIPVTLCGAESGEPVHGVIDNPCVYVPEHNLGPAIQVSIAAQAGDSGGALVDRDNFLLGLLVGGGTKTQYFSPMANIFNELSCDLY